MSKLSNDNDNGSTPTRPVLLVTGMSGAGMSSSLKAFEDLGYEAVDNLRLGLVPALLDFDQTATKPLVIAIDTRNANFSIDAVLRVYELLKTQKDVSVKLVYLECSDETLQRRFTETRRRHPLAVDRPVMDGILKERALLAPLREVADQVIDTSLLSIHDLRRLIAGHFPLATGGGLSIYVMSFSFRQGLPREADLVFDVRFLRNPYWDTALRDQTGQDPPVCAYIEEDEGLQSFMAHLGDLLLPLLPRYQQEGKSYLTIAVGCTGGRHRSVYVAERLARELAVKDYIVGVGHRDMAKANAAQAESGEK